MAAARSRTAAVRDRQDHEVAQPVPRTALFARLAARTARWRAAQTTGRGRVSQWTKHRQDRRRDTERHDPGVHEGHGNRSTGKGKIGAGRPCSALRAGARINPIVPPGSHPGFAGKGSRSRHAGNRSPIDRASDRTSPRGPRTARDRSRGSRAARHPPSHRSPGRRSERPRPSGSRSSSGWTTCRTITSN